MASGVEHSSSGENMSRMRVERVVEAARDCAVCTTMRVMKGRC